MKTPHAFEIYCEPELDFSIPITSKEWRRIIIILGKIWKLIQPYEPDLGRWDLTAISLDLRLEALSEYETPLLVEVVEELFRYVIAEQHEYFDYGQLEAFLAFIFAVLRSRAAQSEEEHSLVYKHSTYEQDWKHYEQVTRGK